MSLETLRTLALDLAILAALGVAGWFIGAELLAHKAGPSTPINVGSQVVGAETSDGTLVVPLTGLSPFGTHSGLEGRQVLVGRVREVGEGFFTADTPIGLATFRFTDGSTFLLRLERGSPADLQPGAVVSVVAASETDGAYEAASVLVLPQASRPSIQGFPPGFQAGAGGDDGGGNDGGGENGDAGREDAEPDDEGS